MIAAKEDPLEVTGGDLPRITLRIGNRHTPCQIEPTHLAIPRDYVIRDMAEKIGKVVREITAPLRPEGRRLWPRTGPWPCALISCPLIW